MKIKKVRKMKGARNLVGRSPSSRRLVSLDAKQRRASRMRHKNERRALEKGKRIEET